MTTRLHIVCKSREPLGMTEGRHPVINEVLPDLTDCEVFAIAEDGTRTALTNVSGVRWAVGGAEPARAEVTFFNATLEAEAIVINAVRRAEAIARLVQTVAVFLLNAPRNSDPTKGNYQVHERVSDGGLPYSIGLGYRASRGELRCRCGHLLVSVGTTIISDTLLSAARGEIALHLTNCNYRMSEPGPGEEPWAYFAGPER